MRSSHARTWPVMVALMVSAVLLSGVAPVNAQALRAPTTADFVDLHELDEVAISPDGEWVAVVIREASSPSEPEGRGERGVYVLRSDGSEAPRRVAPELGVATGVQWSPDGRLSFLARGEGGQQIYVHRPGEAAGAVKQITPGEQAVSRFRWSRTGDEIAFLSAIPRPTGGSGGTGVWILDVATGAAEPLTPAGVNIRDLAWSPDGRAVAVIASGGGEPGTTIRVVDRSGGVRTIAGEAGGPGTRRQVLDWSPDGRTILYTRSAPGRQAGQNLALAPVDGGVVRELLGDYEGIVMRAVWAPDGSIIAQSFEGLLSRLLRVDPESGSMTRLADIMDSYPTFSVTADGSTFAYRGDRLEGPADVWVLREGGSARRVTHLNPQLDRVAVNLVEAFTWTNPEDGTRLEGVLVLPRDHRRGVAYPTIVQLHGGPHFHWGLGWLGDWHDWAQLLASRGYVVFLPNPRGSTGRGTEFASAIIDDIGGIDFRDVMSGVDALVARGIADEDRLGVGGWSYGGFLTARTITQTDRFKGAVMGAGISNLLSFAGTPGLGRGWASSFFGSNPYADRARFEDRSATTHLGDVRTPTLVVHGERDAKISVTQAWELHYGLQYVGVDTDILIFPRAGHGLTARQDRMDYLTSVAEWFDRYVKGGADGAVAGPTDESS